MIFTSASLKNFQPTTRYIRESGSPGFALDTSGHWRWLYIHTVAGKKHFSVLGTYPEMTPEAARQEWRIAHAISKADGAAPTSTQTHQITRLARRNDKGNTYPQFGVKNASADPLRASLREATEQWDKWLRNKVRERTRNDYLYDMERVIAKFKPDTDCRSLSRMDIQSYVNEFVTAGHSATGRRVKAALGAFFTYCTRSGWVEISPVSKIELPKAVKRQRFARVSELKAIWSGIEDSQMSLQARYGLQLIIMYGWRINEVCGLQVSDWWQDESLIVIPQERMKNKLPHALPVTRQAALLLERLSQQAKWGYFLPTPSSKRGSVSEDTVRQALSRVKDVQDITPHDLRRTVGTQLVRLGVTAELADRILSHVVDSTIRSTYVVYDYQREKLAALQMYHDWLEANIDMRF